MHGILTVALTPQRSQLVSAFLMVTNGARVTKSKLHDRQMFLMPQEPSSDKIWSEIPESQLQGVLGSLHSSFKAHLHLPEPGDEPPQ